MLRNQERLYARDGCMEEKDFMEENGSAGNVGSDPEDTLKKSVRNG